MNNNEADELPKGIMLVHGGSTGVCRNFKDKLELLSNERTSLEWCGLLNFICEYLFIVKIEYFTKASQ